MPALPWRHALARLLLYALLALVLVALLFPVLLMLLNSLKSGDEFARVPPTFLPRQPTLNIYAWVFSRMDYFTALRNTVIVAGLSALGATLLGGMAAWSFSRATFAGKALVYGLLVASIAVPAMVTLGPLFIAYSEIGLLDTLSGLVLVNLATGLPLSVLVLFSYYNAVPRELDDAAALDGCGWFSTLFRVILPVAMPGVVVTYLLLLIAGWNEFPFAFVLTVGPDTRVLSVRLLEAAGRSALPGSAGGVLMLLPLLWLLLRVQRRLAEAFSLGLLGDG